MIVRVEQKTAKPKVFWFWYSLKNPKNPLKHPKTKKTKNTTEQCSKPC